MPTITAVTEAISDCWDVLHDPGFAKTIRFESVGERPLLPLVGMFLAGRFPQVAREQRAALPGSGSGAGRLDYVIGDVAIELAVRKDGQATTKLMPEENTTEVRKLLKHPGSAVLVLFDFASKHVDVEALEEAYRDWRTQCGIGEGNHKLSAFNVRYFHLEATAAFNVRI